MIDLIPLSTLGTTLVLGALGMAAAGSVLGFVSGARSSLTGLQWTRRLALGFSYCMILANVVMVAALLSRDFSVSYVAEVGTWEQPLHITIVSLWASLSGSILLWGGVLGVYVVGIILGLGDRHRIYQPWMLGVLLSICVMFALLVAGIANPFAPTEADVLAGLNRAFGTTASGMPADGPGPNPLLQNHWLMIIHPPTLYLGYVGMAVPFAMSAAALLAGRLESGWMAPLRRAFLVPWAFLTGGIILGGWWSYAVLGWGGYWAWDPVENASFLPWLTGTAFLHSSMLMHRRASMKSWTLILGMVTFLLTLFGTFLTRSGVFNSVHAFGTGAVGPVLLSFIAISGLFSVVLLGLRVHTLTEGAVELPRSNSSVPRADRALSSGTRTALSIGLWAALVIPPAAAVCAALWFALPVTFNLPFLSEPLTLPEWAAFAWLPLAAVLLARRNLSRDFMIVAQNATFSVFTLVVFLGTVYPIMAEALRDKKVSVGEPFFDAFGFPLGVIIVWLMGLGPMLPWGQTAITSAWKRFLAPLSFATVMVGVLWATGITKVFVLIALFVCFAALAANLGELIWPSAARLRRGGGLTGITDLLRMGRRRWGGHLAHYGVIMCVIGMALSRGYSVEKDLMFARGETVTFDIPGETEAYALTYVGGDRDVQSHRTVNLAQFEVSRAGVSLGTYSPAINNYKMREEGIPSPDIRSTWSHDLYLSLLSVPPDGSRASLHVKWIPGVLWIWLSGLLIVLGTAISVWPERRRQPRAAPHAAPETA